MVQNYRSDTSPFHNRRQALPEDLPKQTPPPEYEQQWAPNTIPTTSLPNTIQTVILICNAKEIPNAIARKNCKTKTVKTIGLEVYA